MKPPKPERSAESARPARAAPVETEADPFLRDLLALEREGAATAPAPASAEPPLDAASVGLAALSELLPELAPPAGLRAQLLAELPETGRFERFATTVAELLDLGLDQARALLDRLDEPACWTHELPGISFFWVEGGPLVASALRGFLRVRAGADFPTHEHLGDEVTLVLQGSLEDRARGLTLRPGDVDRMPAGSAHDYHVPAGGPDLLQLAVTHVGVRALGRTWSPP